jgi:protein O-mannosyl-transferase
VSQGPKSLSTNRLENSSGPLDRAVNEPGAIDPRDRVADLILCLLLVGSVVAVYYPSITGGLLLDDDLHITVPHLRSLAGLWRIWTDIGATQQYYPVLHSAFWLENRLWGDSLVGYHLINALFHAAVAISIVPLMRLLRLPGAWFAAFAFALHPVCVESVAWIAEQKNTLSTALAIGSTILYLEFDLRGGRLRYCLATFLFAAALLSKTAVIVLPAILVVIAWWRRPKISFQRDLLPLLPWFLMGSILSLVTISVEKALLSEIGANLELTLAGKLILASRALWFYASKLVFPTGLTFFYPKWSINSASAAQYVYPLSAAILIGVLVVLSKRRRGPLAAFLCYSLALLPVLGFVGIEWFVFSYVADHLQYMAVVCATVAGWATLASFATRLPPSAHFTRVILGSALLGTLGLMTWHQSERYSDPETFYRTAARMNPESAAARNHLGTVLASEPGREKDAIEEFQTALRISPNAPDGEENLATVLLKDPSRRKEAEAHLRSAIRLRPNRKSTHDKLAFVLSDRPDRAGEMIAEYHSSLQIDPKDANIHYLLGAALMNAPGGLQEAEAELEAAIHLNPDFAEAHYNLGNVLKRLPGRINDSIGEFREALRLRPGFAEAHNGIGLCYAQIPGQLNAAISEFREALRLNPDFSEAHSNLGLALSFLPGRIDDGLVEIREALRLKPDFAPGWHLYGLVLMQAGRTKDAADAFEHELQLVPGNADAQSALANALAEPAVR